MSIIEAIREHIKTCPLIAGESLHVDFLSEEAGSYSIDVAPSEEVVRRYIDGSTQRQFTFVFSCRESYGENTLQNLENLGFFEAFALWLTRGDLPVLDGDRQAQKMEVTTSGYAYSADDRTARYQIQCRLLYFQGR